MSGEELGERLKTLPKWAQAYIDELNRQREEIYRQLEKIIGEQKKQPFYITELACLESGAPQEIVRYLDTHCVTFEHRGLRVDITRRPQGISIQYGGPMLTTKDILCTPVSFQQFEIRYPEGK